MEIKKGDKVRVSKDAPSIYTPDWVDAMFDLVLKVTKVEDGNAMVVFEKSTQYKTVLTTIPTKYLVKVDAEAEKTYFDQIRDAANGVERQDYGHPIQASMINLGVGWDAYAADLAKEIVLKTVNSASDRRPMSIAEYATDIAKAVVEGLKRK